MGVYENFSDKPGQIKSEGQNITISFQRISDTTGRITWNIPAPSNGCNSSNQAYDGILITINTAPSNYLSNSPVDGVYYKDDPTADSDLHTGDKLDGALILAALYNDRITTSIDVTDLKEKTPYYVSGYAVDSVARYHREGVHAYSIPSGPLEPNTSQDLVAIQDIGIDTGTSVTPTTLTGLVAGTTYTTAFLINNKRYDLSFDGVLALDYDDLIYTLNQQFIALTEPKYVGPYPPNAGNYYCDISNEKIYKWSGYENVLQASLFQNNDPTSPILESLWYNPNTTVLSEYESSGWVAKDYLKSEFDFSEPKCYQFWFNGTSIFKWEKVVWRELPTYISTTNPLIPTGLDCNTYWYNITDYTLSNWDEQVKSWNVVEAIYYDQDPNTIISGNYWYNQTDGKVYIYLSGNWSLLNNVTYIEPVNGEYPNPVAPNHYWFIPSQQILYIRNMANTAWVELDVVKYTSSPTVRTSGQLWWDASNDNLYIWDIVNTAWVQVSHFYQTDVDPNAPIDIPLNSAWYNPNTNIITLINNLDCTPINYVYSLTDPTVVTLGKIWFNDVANTWFEWNGSGWSQIFPFVNNLDPFSVFIDECWFNPASNTLYVWDGSAWVEKSYSTTSLTPELNSLWYNELDNNLYEWNGVTYVVTTGIAKVTLVLSTIQTCPNCRGTYSQYWNVNDGWNLPYPKDIIRISTKEKGCNQHIELCFIGQTSTTKDLFSSLTQSVIYFMPLKGQTKSQSGPMYMQLGVGDDGSPDERRTLHATVRSLLGGSGFKVELTKDDIDTCINNALLVFRKRSSFSYKRGMFFLDVKPNQQMYLLKDSCVGFNKIVDINSIYRMRGTFMSSAYGGDNMFGFAALQQMYTLGTFDLLSYHLVSSYMKELQRAFADNIMFQWVESKRELRMYKKFFGLERVLLDVSIERTEQDLITDRESAIWIQRWAVAEAKGMLSQVRGKFTQLTGPNGSTTLNFQELSAQSETEKAALLLELEDNMYQNLVDVGSRSSLVIG